MKTCIDCLTDLTGSHGNRRRCPPCGAARVKASQPARSAAWYTAHPERAKARSDAWHAANPDKVAAIARRSQLKAQYKMTPEEWDKKVAEQGGLCALCRTRPATDTDHDWYTGEVRGILCPPCNKGIGHLGDNSAGVQPALRYLALHEGAFLGAGL